MDEPLTKFFLNFGKMNTSHGADLRSLVGVARYEPPTSKTASQAQMFMMDR